MKRYRVTDYTNPGAGMPLGHVRAVNWDEAAAKAEARWPGRQLSVSSYA